MFCCRVNWLLASGCIAVLLAHTAAGDEAAEAISKLLDVGWSITPQARQAADAQYEELTKIAPRDPRALEAWWLVLMQQRRFDEALKQIELHLKREPDDLAAWRAKTWVHTVLKNYSSAFVAAERLSALLAAHEPAEDAHRALHAESIGFLGRLLGYVGGPIADAVNQDERKVLEKKFLDRLADSERPLFEDARNGVLARFLEMTDESADARDKAQALANAEKAKTLAELQSDREKLDERAKELEERRKKLNSELKAELTEIDRQEQPLVQQQAQLAARSEALNADLFNYSSQITTLQSLAAKEKDAALRQQYLNQANSLSFLASRVEADLNGANRLWRGLQAQRSGLQARRGQAQASSTSQVDRLARELADLDKRERRNEGLERRAGRSATTSTSKVRSLSAQATALSTYDAFPLEAAKARLLESLQ
jgi:hypothetical protein